MVIDHYECPNSKTKPSASTGQLPSLTSLRGLAALWVVLYHYCVQCFPNLDVAHYTQLIGKGYLAVDMFFMLSGFVMTHVYYRAFSDSNGIMLHYRGFLVARIARLYPLHIFMLLLFVATAVTSQLMAGSVTSPLQSIPLKGPESVTAFLANIFMLQGLEAGKLSWNYPSWSISVEFMAYLAFPLALPLVWRAPHPVKFVLGLLLFCALGWLAFLKRATSTNGTDPSLCCVASRSFCWLNGDAVAICIAVATILCLHFGAPDLLIVALFAALIPVAVVNAGRFAKVTNAAPLIWLGEISYSLYLIHGFVQFVAKKILGGFGIQHSAALSGGGSLALMLLMVAVCFLAATATYSGVEVAWRRYLRNLFGGRQKNRPPDLLSSQQA